MVGLMLRGPGREGVRELLLLDVRVGHKSSSTDAAAHDVGIVLPQGAEPHVLIVLTEVSRRVYARSEAYP